MHARRRQEVVRKRPGTVVLRAAAPTSVPSASVPPLMSYHNSTIDLPTFIASLQAPFVALLTWAFGGDNSWQWYLWSHIFKDVVLVVVAVVAAYYALVRMAEQAAKVRWRLCSWGRRGCAGCKPAAEESLHAFATAELLMRCAGDDDDGRERTHAHAHATGSALGSFLVLIMQHPSSHTLATPQPPPPATSRPPPWCRPPT